MKDNDPGVCRNRWSGCDCDECRVMGKILCKFEPVFDEVLTELRNGKYHFTADVIDHILEVIGALSSIHIAGAMQAADLLRSVSDFTMERAREFRMRGIVQGEVETVLRAILTPVESVSVDPETGVPTGHSKGCQVFSVNKKPDGGNDNDGGNGGSNLH